MIARRQFTRTLAGFGLASLVESGTLRAAQRGKIQMKITDVQVLPVGSYLFVHAQVVPHNPLSPVSTAACVQLAACIPNFALQEYPQGEDKPPKSEIVRGALKLESGFLIVPDTPGIGVELAEGAAERHPYRARELKTRLNVDGSVVDQ